MPEPTATSPVPHYNGWSAVPPGIYMTRTQLADLDLPRTPGPVAATVTGYNWRGKEDTFDLHRIDQSTPTSATPRQLAASRARSKQDPRTCTDCGAHTEHPCAPYADGALLCLACLHIHSLRASQQQAAISQAEARRTAAELLADPSLAVVHLSLTDRGLTPSGAQRSPSAVHLVAVDATNSTLIDTTVRLVGPRSKGIPESALAPEDAAGPVTAALDGRRVVHWDAASALSELYRVLRAAGGELTPARPRDLRTLTFAWRADLDPRTSMHRHITPPGRADRLLYLLQQIAAPAATPPGDTP
ncbi:hypothetical protein [Streptomyces sp. C10-9-1]|uniref:hypothetical protein n=1 Tax=Streptomyces sp. C10-9-1 TaxID=1859285 RepID=UPI003F49C797